MDGYTDATLESIAPVLAALSNPHRARIMQWLIDPRRHFPAQKDGDLVDDGVCVGFITDKIGLSQPTVTNHMQVLAGAGLVSGRKIKNWVFYKPDRNRLAQLAGVLQVMSGEP